jgi:(1->4)-alpha-D-glucan 1-alpha-D-glucosylmutase
VEERRVATATVVEAEAVAEARPGAARRPRRGPAAKVPRATYRLQLNPGFTFRDATRIVPYLAELGVSDVYASPYLAASPGSSHGYDVADYAAINPELGSEADYRAFVAALARHGMGQVCDFVPNHMGIGHGRNAWWQDVLENGQASPYAEYFDIDWRPLKPELRDKVLLPILGDHYGAVLERGELQLRLEEGAFTVWYFDRPFPIAPPTYPRLLRHRLDALIEELSADDPDLLELQSVVTALERLPGNDERDPGRIAERQREQTIAKRRLADLLRASAPVRAAVAETVREFNGAPGDPRSFDLLDALLEEQVYRLASWRVAGEEINYRRFFAINELAAIRQEVPDVLAATHALMLRLVGEGAVTGLRIDHPDGLWDPAGYFRQLQAAAGRALRGEEATGGEPMAEGEAEAGDELPLYLVVEKILEHGEPLPATWAVHGTVGYDFATAATGLFVDGANRKAFDALYARFTGEKVDFADLVYACKHLIMRRALVSEVNVLARALNRISEQDRRSRDFTWGTLREAMREVIACFPVYRTYLVCEDEEGTVAERDRRFVEAAVAQAKRRNPGADPSVLDFVRDVLLLRHDVDLTEAQRAERCRFGMRFQQLTGPVMAKGLEDTAFYRYNRLTALNEVGGDPTQFGVPVAAFHRQNAERRRRWPHAMLCSSTHDTKRSEDVRARIAVLSEMPREWRAAINRWARLNRKRKTRVEGAPAPDRNDEYLLYQTLLGAWPDEEEGREQPDWPDRVEAYLLKAIREAQRHTNWVNPNEAYEEATRAFVRAVLDPALSAPFLADFAALRRRVAHLGAFNALGQQLLKLTSPGVPDVYQGTELWDLSLVDPDNRRPVDFARRARLLRDLRRRKPSPRLARDLVRAKADGRVKLWLTQRALACRAAALDLFACGDYLPLAARGAQAGHVCAFARRLAAIDGEREVVVVVPRLVASLVKDDESAPTGAAVWGETTIPLPDAPVGGAYRNVFTDEVARVSEGPGGAGLRLAEVLATFPVALLERVGDGGDAAR